jgi:hypothetical protein
MLRPRQRKSSMYQIITFLMMLWCNQPVPYTIYRPIQASPHVDRPITHPKPVEVISISSACKTGLKTLMNLFEESRPQISCKLGRSCSPNGKGGQDFKTKRMEVFQSRHVPTRSKSRDCGWKEGSIAILQFIKRVQCGTETAPECGKLKLS